MDTMNNEECKMAKDASLDPMYLNSAHSNARAVNMYMLAATKNNTVMTRTVRREHTML
jgi:hypothetical protein